MTKKIYLSAAAIILIIFSSAFIFSASQKTTKYSLTVPYTVDMAKANMDVYWIKGPDLNIGTSVEYYNIDRLDEFINYTKEGQKGKIRVIKYAKGNEGCELKWMYDIEYVSGRYKLNIYAKDSIVDNQYKPIFTKIYDTLVKTGNKKYTFSSGEDQVFDLL
jgi:hypothetical protein